VLAAGSGAWGKAWHHYGVILTSCQLRESGTSGSGRCRAQNKLVAQSKVARDLALREASRHADESRALLRRQQARAFVGIQFTLFCLRYHSTPAWTARHSRAASLV
jgi:hypothetical protein